MHDIYCNVSESYSLSFCVILRTLVISTVHVKWSFCHFFYDSQNNFLLLTLVQRWLLLIPFRACLTFTLLLILNSYLKAFVFIRQV